MTVLIIDGMDRSGKDTIVRGLIAGRRTSKPLHHVHNVAPPALMSGGIARGYHLAVYLAQLKIAAQWPEHDFVVNRSWLSEEVYGHLYRGQPAELPRPFMEDVHDVLDGLPHLVVTLVDGAAETVARSDGDSTFEKEVGSRKKTEDREYALKMAGAERELFLAAHARLGAWGVKRACYDGRRPEEVLGEVRQSLSSLSLGW